MLRTLLIAVAVLGVLGIQGSQKKVYTPTPNKQSRDFVAWMKTVPTDPQFGSGLKRLVLNINPSLTQEQADAFTVGINEAAKRFPDFCNSGDEKKDKAEFAAFLSIVGAETSFSVMAGFPCEVENGCPNCDACSYNSYGKECVNNPKKQYFGRGPLQLSWNYNYGDYSEFYYQNRSVLIEDPDLVLQSPASCWSSSIWFWMIEHDFGGWCMPQAAWNSFNYCEDKCFLGPAKCSDPLCTANHWVPRSKASCHNAMQGSLGIGTVISIINGGYDCCPSTSYGNSYGHTSYRIWWFQDIYHVWTNDFATPLDPVPIRNCPYAEGINCKAMQGTCWNVCCSK